MRLICPNCGAQYEVDDKVIPDSGRDVQCSNCGHTWFQQPAHMDADLADELGQDLPEDYETPDPSEAPSAKPRSGLDPETANVLREEAAHEAEARRAETTGVETQPDLGLDEAADDAAAKSAAARVRMARLRGQDDASADAAAADRSRKEMLPDIEEINSTLRAAEDRDPDAPVSDLPVEEVEKPRRRGFRLGFGLSMLAVATAVLAYRFAPQIVGTVPQSEPFLAAYVDWANAMRGQVNGVVDAGLQWINQMVGGSAGGDI